MIFESMTKRDAIDLLKADHRKVESLFSEFESADEGRRKVELAQQICTELAIHAQIEEEIFYPAAQRALDKDGRDLVDEATVEHTSLKNLIADIDGSAPGDDLFEANVKVLSEYVKHHVREEENELMPAVRRTNIDLEALGEKLEARKQALMKSMTSRTRSARGRSNRVSVPTPGRARPAAKSRTRKSAAATKRGSRAPTRAKARKSGGRTSKSAKSRTGTTAARKRVGAGSRSSATRRSRSR